MSALGRSAGLVGIGLAAILGACDSPTVPPRLIAYEFAFEGFGERLIYRWPDGHTIGVHAVPSGDATRDATLEAAVAHAARVWNDAVLYGEYRLEPAPLERADVIVAWSDQFLPIDTSDCPPFPHGAAWTTFCADPDFTTIEAYPLLEGEHRSDGVHVIVQVLATNDEPGLATALVAHEFGHVLGIGTHPCRLGPENPLCTRREGAHESLMYVGIPERATPSSADRSTIEVLYHTRPHLTP